MYPPPQPTYSSPAPRAGEHQKHGAGILRTYTKFHSHPEPFSYEYILEEGKLPVLAEFHPKTKKAQESRTLPSQPQIQQHSSLQRSKSLKRKEKHIHFD